MVLVKEANAGLGYGSQDAWSEGPTLRSMVDPIAPELHESQDKGGSVVDTAEQKH